MIIILIIIAIIIYLIVIPNAHLLHDFLSYFLPVSTLCIGIFVWYNEQKENYMNQLPKKLNVKYQLDEKYFEIINAPLAHEGDIRAWGQAIAKNVLNARVDVDYSGYFIDKPIVNDEKKVYTLTIYLTKEITGIEFGKSYYFGNDGKYIGLKNS